MAIANELTINTTATAADMFNAIFGNGIQLVGGSATYSGAAASSGIYSGAMSTLAGIVPTDSGVILSTGRVSDFTNSSGTTDTNTSALTGIDVVGGIDGDAQMNAVSGMTTFDGAILAADFIPTGDLLTMQFVFSSEEYPEYVNGGVNDSFGVWINGQFVEATISVAGNVSIDTVNASANQNLYRDNSSDQFNTEMDGLTYVLSFKAQVNPGAVNSIKIGIADGGDAVYDSNLLIMGDSVQTYALAIDDTVQVAANASRTFDILANDHDFSGGGLTITHIQGTAVVAGQTVTLNSGEQVRLNANGTVTVFADAVLGSNVLSYTIVDAQGNTDVGYVFIETLANLPLDGIVSGTIGDDLIDSAFFGDPQGDMVDNSDATGVLGTTGNADVIYAGAGNDYVIAADGSDIVDAGIGDDTVFGGAGNDKVTLGDGNDVVAGGSGSDTLYGGDGGDVFAILDTDNGDTIFGGEFAGTTDTLSFANAATTQGVSVTFNAAEAGVYQYAGAPGTTGSFAEIEAISGTAYNDVINAAASAAAVTLVGNAGNDTITGGSASDVIDGSEGGDSLLGGAGHDTLYGGQGADWLIGGAGNDVLYGGEGSDAFVIPASVGLSSSGTDTVIGGESGYDYDSLVLNDLTQAVTVTFTGSEAGSYLYTSGASGTFSEIENVEGSAMADSMNAALALTDIDLRGYAGNDTLIGGAGEDYIEGGVGDDSLTGNAGNDLINGDEGNDTISGGTGDDSLFAGLGNDSLLGGEGNDALVGSDGNDTLIGGAGNDMVQGGNDADLIWGTAGDSIVGGEGGTDNDTLVVSNVIGLTYGGGNNESGVITLQGGSTLAFSEIEHLVLNGGNPDGIIYGSAGDDSIGAGYVDANGDVIDNNDAILGAPGSNDDEVYAGAGNDTVTGLLGNDFLYGGDGNDSLSGGVGNDYMQGDAGNDAVLGGDGNDLLRGDAGNDVVDGGAGDDTVYGGADSDTVYGGDGNDQVYGGFGDDTVYGGAGNDTITGSGQNDLVSGDDGDDFMQGSDGADTLIGGAGNDTMLGEEDADSFYGGMGDYVDGYETVTTGSDNDTLHVSGVDHIVWEVLNPENGTVHFTGGGTLQFYNIEHVIADGTEVPPPNYIVEGTAGDDLINAGFTGDPQGDRVDASDSATANNDDLIYAGAGNDTVVAGDGNDTLHGGAGEDVLIGEAGDDLQLGGTGNDIFYDGAGNDTLLGEADRDSFAAGIGDVVDGGETGDDHDTLDLTAWGHPATNIIYDTMNPENGTVEFLDASGAVIGSMAFSNIENVVACFTPGTMILTDQGEVAVEDLAEGDLVLTRDCGFQPIRWVGRRDLTAEDLAVQPRFNPVRIAQGALGGNLPERDMLVSPQHRMLMTGARAELLFGEHEVLVAATHMVGMAGVDRVMPDEVSYIHILFDRHEVVRADGAWSESFQPGVQTMNGLDAAQRAEILALFPKIGLGERFPAARLTLKSAEAQVLLRVLPT